jgi:CheY-like chemotaxis protein
MYHFPRAKRDLKKRVAGLLNTNGLRQLEGEMEKTHNKLTFSVGSERQASNEIQSTRGLADQLNEGTVTILLVDDEKLVLETVSGMLERLGYNVLIAGSGMEAIDYYKEKMETIDLIILDMIMPKMDGGKTFEKIKEINPNAKVLLSSGYSIDGQVAEKLKDGCDGFIQKPFNLRNLCGKLIEILNPTTHTTPKYHAIETVFP